MVIMAILLGMILLLMGFAVYIAGLISSKLDLILFYTKTNPKHSDDGEEDFMKKQFMGMMNYTAEEWRESDE